MRTKKVEGYDPTWKEQAETARKELEKQQFDFALEKAVASAKPKNAKAIIGLLDREKLTYAGGEILGLDKQLSALKSGEDTAFLFEEAKPIKTGLSHQNAHAVGGGGCADGSQRFSGLSGMMRHEAYTRKNRPEDRWVLRSFAE